MMSQSSSSSSPTRTSFSYLLLFFLLTMAPTPALAQSQDMGDLARDMDGTVEGRDWIVIVDLVILVCTICGASVILGSMLYREHVTKRASTIRMRLVQGLVFSDLLLGLIGTITSSEYLSGKIHPHGSPFCDAFGILLVIILWSEHLWTFALAWATYMILIYPLHPVTRYLETSWYLFFIAIYAVSVGFALLGHFLYGYYPSGGICYYGSNSGLYGELMQFIPRACVFISIFFFYARLYVFLKRPDKIRASFSPSPGNTRNGLTGYTDSAGSVGSIDINSRGEQEGSAGRKRTTRARGASRDKIREGFGKFTFRPKTTGKEEKTVEMNEKTDRIELNAVQGETAVRPKDYGDSENEKNGQGRSGITPGNNGSQTMTREEIPPWERIELPAFEIDGQRYGGSASNTFTNNGSATGFWGEWKGIGRKREASSTNSRPESPGTSLKSTTGNKDHKAGRRSRESSLVISHIHRDSVPGMTLPPIMQEDMTPTTHIIAPSPLSPEVDAFPSPKTMDQSVFERSRRQPGSIAFQSAQHMVDPKDDSPEHMIPSPTVPSVPGSDIMAPSTYSSTQGLIPALRRASAEPGTRRESCTSPSDTESRRGSGPVSFVLPTSARKESTMYGGDMQVSSQSSSERRDATPRQSSDLAGARERAIEEDDDEDDEMDFEQFLRNESAADEQPVPGHQRYASEDTVFVQESTASYLNRKTAMLMLYFPLAYCVLFSVSLVRIIYDLARDDEPVGLRAVSRWFVFAQGAVDAFIYGFVEWNTKRVVRRKVRKGLMTPSGSRHSWKAGATAEDMLASNKNRSKSQGFRSRISQMTSSQPRRQTTSTV